MTVTSARRVACALATSIAVTMSPIAAGGERQTSAPAREQATVTGYVTDEAGQPVPGATVRVLSSLQAARRDEVSVSTTATGAFSATFPASPRVLVDATHPDYGLQFTGGASPFGAEEVRWTAFSYAGPVPATPITLQLRRGVVLRGRVVGPSGQPFAGEPLFVVPSYIGSGPLKLETVTDLDGEFEFPRMVLKRFELVPHSLDYFAPGRAGTYLRVTTQTPEIWAAEAAAGRSVEVLLQSYTRVDVTLDVSSLKTNRVYVSFDGSGRVGGTGTHDVGADGQV